MSILCPSSTIFFQRDFGFFSFLFSSLPPLSQALAKASGYPLPPLAPPAPRRAPRRAQTAVPPAILPAAEGERSLLAQGTRRTAAVGRAALISRWGSLPSKISRNPAPRNRGGLLPQRGGDRGVP